MLKKLDYNAPTTLTFAIVALVVLGVGQLTGGVSTTGLFCVYAASWTNPLTYVRLFGHVLGHSGLSHYINNMMLILLLGPIVESQYGSRRLLAMMVITAGVTGLVTMVFLQGIALMGSSGIVFLMILLSSLGNRRREKIPVTFLAVAALYLGQEVYAMLFTVDNVSQLAHLIGGGTGILFGLVPHRGK